MAVTDTKTKETYSSDLDTADKDPTYSRRKFLTWGIYGVGAAVTVAVGVPIALYFVKPALNAGESGKILIDIGTPAEFANQTSPKPVIKNFKYTDTFKEAEGSKQVFVRALKAGSSDPKDFQVIDSTCTHAGCTVAYNPPDAPAEAKGKFYCPCHHSIFDVDGTNLAVAPRPLHKYAVELTKDGKLAINVFEATA